MRFASAALSKREQAASGSKGMHSDGRVVKQILALFLASLFKLKNHWPLVEIINSFCGQNITKLWKFTKLLTPMESPMRTKNSFVCLCEAIKRCVTIWTQNLLLL